MRLFALAALLLALIGGAVVAQSDHHPVYLVGGYQGVSSGYWSGLWLLDRMGQTTTLSPIQAALPLSTQRNAVAMDADNRCLLMGFMSSYSTITSPWVGVFCRFDPATQVTSTLCKLYHRPGQSPGGWAATST